MSGVKAEDQAVTQVLICGGGNAAHVLASLGGSRPGFAVRVLTLLKGEAARWEEGLSLTGSISCENDLGEPYVGTPSKVSEEPAEVVPGSDIIILSLPAFAHEACLKAIVPYLTSDKKIVIGAMPGQAGFDMCVRDCLGPKMALCSIFTTETLPWACRITTFGSKVLIQGTKKVVDMAVSPRSEEKEVAATLQSLVGPLPVLQYTDQSFLGITLMNINAVWHTGIMSGILRNWDGQSALDVQPEFYGSVDDYTAAQLTTMSDEVLAVKKELIRQYPQLKLVAVRHVREWVLRSYGDEILDKTDLKTMITSNVGYRNLKVACKPGPDGTGFVPDMTNRYLTEDVPFGLVVIKGVAELAGSPTPTIDKVLGWCQERIGKEYLVDGKLTGKDMGATRAPQRYGYKDLETLMAVCQYEV